MARIHAVLRPAKARRATLPCRRSDGVVAFKGDVEGDIDVPQNPLSVASVWLPSTSDLRGFSVGSAE
jgi:hypothetical protein